MEIEEKVDSFLNSLREPLTKAVEGGEVSLGELDAVLSSIRKSGSSRVPIRKDLDKELERIGAEIAKMVNGEG